MFVANLLARALSSRSMFLAFPKNWSLLCCKAVLGYHLLIFEQLILLAFHLFTPRIRNWKLSRALLECEWNYSELSFYSSLSAVFHWAWKSFRVFRVLSDSSAINFYIFRHGKKVETMVVQVRNSRGGKMNFKKATSNKAFVTKLIKADKRV